MERKFGIEIKFIYENSYLLFKIINSYNNNYNNNAMECSCDCIMK